MKIFLTAMICLMLCVPAFADQQTTVLTEQVKLDKAAAQVPFVDGSNDLALEKNANMLLRERAKKLVNEVGGAGTLTYKVMLNRPSVFSVLLTAKNGNRVAYDGVNVDLTSGREFTVTDFFIDNDKVKAALGDYRYVLFGEEGFYLQDEKHANYEKFVPYAGLLDSMRIGEAGRLMQVARLTANAEGKTLTLKDGGLVAIKLDGNPSTGYGWHVKSNSENIKAVGTSFTIPAADDQRVGTPGVEIIMLAVKGKGEYPVTMEYKRSWEQFVLKSFTFNVKVE